MDGLSSALDALAADDLFALPAPELLDRTRDLVAARNRLDAELARTVRRAELAQAPESDGLRTMQSWLRGHARLSNPAAAQVVRNGRALEQLDAVAAAYAAGQVTAEQVAVIGKRSPPRTWPGRPSRVWTCRGWTRCWRSSPPAGSTPSWPGWCTR